MPGPNRTQKQIAEKYKGNLDYFHKGHYYRRLRAVCFLLAAIGSIAAALTFPYWGKQEYFSTGPISANHASFAQDCQVCHEGANTDLFKVLPIGKAHPAPTGSADVNLRSINAASPSTKAPSLTAVKSSADDPAPGLKKDKLTALAEQGLALTDIARMDRACLKCHDAMHLHQPQTEALQMRTVRRDLPLVHTGSCAVCHREHVGAEPMKLPGAESCAACHYDRSALARTRELLRLNNPHLPTRAENRDLGDGVIRFIAPPGPEGELVTFESYEKGHPPFAYEKPNLRDPAAIEFNHWRHAQPDIPPVAGRKLDCTYCHRPTANGIFYQRVNFEEHCQTCHGLTIDPDIPQIAVPHGDALKVRTFIANLGPHYREYFRSKGITEDAALYAAIKGAVDRLSARNISSLKELERRVFFTGDPDIQAERVSPRGNKTVLFPGCTKCHEVLPGVGDGPPKIVPTNMAERWVHGGPFTHVEHQHMECTDCHGAARESKLTTDILMPPQKLCAECHREDPRKPLAGSSTLTRADLKPGSAALAEAQRREGGVKWDCQSCHSFHAPPSAAAFVNAEKK